MKLRSEFFCPGLPAATERVAEIESEGGFAFTKAEFGSNMSGQEEYMGHRVYYLTLDDMRKHVEAHPRGQP